MVFFRRKWRISLVRMPLVQHDAWIAAMLAMAAFCVCLAFCICWLPNYTALRQGRVTVEPAVMMALGMGYVNPDPASVPFIKEFVDRKQGGLNPESVPLDVPLLELTFAQQVWFYILGTMGLCWRIFGVAWEHLAFLHALFFAMATVALYALFRVAMGRLASIAGVVILVLSPVHLMESSGFRDYSKAPFMLGVFALLGLIVGRRMAYRKLLVACAGIGALIAGGMAYRGDVLACLPPALIVAGLLSAVPRDKRVRRRLLAVAVLFISWFSLNFVLNAFRPNVHEGAKSMTGSLFWHVFNTGLMEAFQKNIGLGGAPYDAGLPSHDLFTRSIGADYGHRRFDAKTYMMEYSSDYDTVARQYYVDLAKTLPADRLLQGYASTLQVLNTLPFLDTKIDRKTSFDEHPSDYPNPIVVLHEIRWRLFGWMYGHGWLLACLTIILLTVWNLRAGIAAFFFLMYFGAYTCLQYDARHIFHMEFVPWWCLLFLITQACLFLRARKIKPLLAAVKRRWRVGRMHRWGALRRPVALVAIAVLLLFLPLPIARFIQQRQMTHVCHAVMDAPRTSFQVERGADGGILKGEELFTGPTLSPDDDNWDLRADYLAVELEGKGEKIALDFNYDKTSWWADFSRRITTYAGDPVTGGETWLYVPVYRAVQSDPAIPGEWGFGFSNLFVRETDMHLVKGVYRVSLPSELRTPALYLDIRPGWETRPLRVRMIGVERPRASRAVDARRHNLIPQGDFESWPEGNAAPEGFQPPAGSSVLSKESTHVARGAFAVRQNWWDTDGSLTVDSLFHIRIDTLKPATEYELYTKSRHSGKIDASVAAYQVMPDGNVERLMLRLAELRPGPWFSECSRRFTTLPGEKVEVLLCTYVGPSEFPGWVIWDDWRLLEIGPAR